MAPRQVSDSATCALIPVVVLAGALYVSLAAEWPKFSRAEVFFAECSREMIAAHNWITPLYHAHPFFDKPILAYWLVGSAFTVFGASHLAARIPSILAALATVLTIGVCTRRTFGNYAGTIAAMALASSFMFLSFAALCMSDMLLVLFDTLTMVLLYVGYRNGGRRTLLWSAASLTMALAFITKGPVGVVLPVLAFGSFLLFTKNLCMIKLHHIATALLIIVLIGAPWFFAAYKENGSWALAYFFIRENFQRFAGSTYDTHKPVWFMLVSLMEGFAPWSIVLPVALFKDYRAILNDIKGGTAGSGTTNNSGIGSSTTSEGVLSQALAVQHKLLLWLWLVAVVGFFSFSRGKCDYYVLPAYPAAAALVGACLSELIEKYAGSRLSVILKTAPVVVFCAVCFGGIAFAFCGLPAIGRLLYTTQVCPLIKQTPVATRIGIFNTYSAGIDEITFQTHREPVLLNTVEQLNSFLASPGPALTVVPQDIFASSPGMQHMRIEKKLSAISQPVTPGFILRRRGVLADREPVVLAVNY